MPLFDLPPRSDKSADATIAKKAKKSGKKAPATVRGGGGISALIANIKANVNKYLGQYEDETLIIRDEQTLSDYIDKALAYGEIAIDTETTGLDPLLDEVVGVCLYVPHEKTAYVPMNHVSYITMERIENQLSKEVVAKQLQRLADNEVDIDMFNAVFDIRVIKNRIGVKLKCTWECKEASVLLNENESYGEGGLKPLHNKYVLGGKGDAFSFDDLFDPKKIKFNLVPIREGALYAAHDPKITWELKHFQEQYLYYDPDKPLSDRDGLNGVSWVFFNIEMPIVSVIVNMEDEGIDIDLDYAEELRVKYTKLKEDATQKVYDILEEFQDKIQAYKGDKLTNPINIGSPTQLAILFYDILGYPSVDKKKPRGTGKAMLKKWKTPLADAVLEYKTVDKLLGTFIIKLPNERNPNDGRIHGRFNSAGAKTGRFSSKNPNLQQIPSKNKEVRKMFVAPDGYVLMSSDYSQQEPSCMASFCKEMGYDTLYNVRLGGGDLYSAVASACFNLSYEECLEHFPKDTPIMQNADGTWRYATGEEIALCQYTKLADGETDVYAEGKQRRNLAKPVLLGILYGRGDESVAEGMGISLDEAKQLKANLFKQYPEIQIFEQASLEMAREFGYVTTVCGRKRRLPDLQLPEYSFSWESGYEPVGDILDFDELEVEVPYTKQKFYITKLQNARGWKQRDAIVEKAKQEHIQIVSNRGKIAEATRQCVNARVQGSSADLTKVAMIELEDNQELRDLGFKILVPIHDEILAKCPEKNAKKCAKLLAQIMSHAAEEILKMPFSCDVEVTRCWYGKEYEFEEEEDDE